MRPINILVTGSSGQVVSSLLNAAANSASGEPDGSRTLAVKSVGRPLFDLSQPGNFPTLLEKLAPDVVVNAAAYTAVDKAESEQDAAFAANATGAGLLAHACAQAKTPIIHLSTDYVFDGTKSSPYLESDPVGANSVYGRSKLEGERLVAEAAPQHVILRTSWVHSPYGNNFVKTMLRLAETRDTLNVVDDQFGTPTYAPHLAEAILSIARRLGDSALSAAGPWGTYHASGTGLPTTWCQFARQIFSEAAARELPNAKVTAISSSAYPTPAARPSNSVLNCTKLKSVFGIELPDWRAGVADCLSELSKSRVSDQQRLATDAGSENSRSGATI